MSDNLEQDAIGGGPSAGVNDTDAKKAETEEEEKPKRKRIGQKVLACTSFGIVLGIILGLGVLAGALLIQAANQHQSCAEPARSSSWKGFQISGLPGSLQAASGYGRGTQVITSTLTVTALAHAKLPRAFGVFVEPLLSSSGSQVIPSVVSVNTSEQKAGGDAVSATATQISSSSVYQLEVCIRAPHVAAGIYSSQLLFPGATLASGTSVPLTLTFQSQWVPFILTVGGPIFVLGGMVYTTMILLRRNDPNQPLQGITKNLRDELWSINGVVALVLSVAAVFTTWNIQCYRNPIWGAPWPTVLVMVATMFGAVAGAVTVPMGLSKGDGKSPAKQGA